MDQEAWMHQIHREFQKDFSQGGISFEKYLGVWEKVTEVFRDNFDDESIVIVPETTAKDIEDWDSISNIHLLVAIEKSFPGVRFNTGEIAGLKNVGEMVSLIAARYSQR